MNRRLADLAIGAALAAVLVIGLGLLAPGCWRAGRVLMATDLLYHYSPWREMAPDRVGAASNWILFDEVLEFHPWLLRARRSLAQGELPLWDPSAFCGYPFLATGQTAVLDPLERLLDPFSLERALTLRPLLRMGLAALGGWLLVRMLGAGLSGGALAALSFAFSGFMTAWMGHPHSRTAAFLPLLLWAVERGIRRPGPRSAMILGGLTGLLLLAGHLETAFHVGTGIALYALLRLPFHRKLRCAAGAAGWLVIGALAGCLIASAVLLPFAGYLLESSAYAVRSQGVVTETSFGADLLPVTLVPGFYGSSLRGDYSYPAFNSAELLGLMLGGPVILLMVGALAAKPSGPRLALGAVALLGLGASFAVPPLDRILQAIPLFRMSYNFRFVVLTSGAGGILAGLGLSDLASQERSQRCRWTAFCLGLLLAGLLGIEWAARGGNLPGGANAESELIRAMMVLAVALAAMMLGSRPGNSGRMGRWLLVVIVLAELLAGGAGFNRAFPAKDLAPELTGLAELPRGRDAPRTLGLSFTLPPHTGDLYGLRDIRGNDALTPRRVEEVASRVEPGIVAPTVLPAMRMLKMHRFDHRLIDLMSVGFVVPPPGTPLEAFEPDVQDWTLATSGFPRVFRNPAPGSWAFLVSDYQVEPGEAAGLDLLCDESRDLRRWAVLDRFPSFASGEGSGGVAALEWGIDSELHLRTAALGPTVLVVMETFLPGWHAWVDDRPAPVLRADHAFMGVEVPPGEHRIALVYQPGAFRLGLYLAGLGAILMGSLAVARRRWPWGDPDDPEDDAESA